MVPLLTIILQYIEKSIVGQWYIAKIGLKNEMNSVYLGDKSYFE